VAQAAKDGATIVADETFISGQDKDFSAMLTKIAQTKPDVLLVFGHYADDGLILKQRMDTDLANTPVVVPAAATQQDFIDLAGGGAEGAYVAVFYNLTKDTPQNQEFLKKVAEKFDGAKPGEQVPWGYDGFISLLKRSEWDAPRRSERLHESKLQRANWTCTI
jgi:branched-chain amino acid transport system substrate-binding protein